MYIQSTSCNDRYDTSRPPLTKQTYLTDKTLADSLHRPSLSTAAIKRMAQTRQNSPAVMENRSTHARCSYHLFSPPAGSWPTLCCVGQRRQLRSRLGMANTSSVSSAMQSGQLDQVAVWVSRPKMTSIFIYFKHTPYSSAHSQISSVLVRILSIIVAGSVFLPYTFEHYWILKIIQRQEIFIDVIH